jgi:hypothetical protein|tara:strand:+ start:124 stop:459 length:336 start_codon:yes stop_codon:yes gene_type:complete
MVVSALKFENIRAKIGVFRRKFCHAVLDSRKRQAIPPDLFTTPDRLQSDTRTYGEDFLRVFAIFFCSNIAKKRFSYRIPDLVSIYTPEEAYNRIFVTEGSFFARPKMAKLV